jgi:hypothetical protein
MSTVRVATNATSTAAVSVASALLTLPPALLSSPACERERLVVRQPLFAYLYVYAFSAIIALGVPCNTLAFVVLLRDRVATTSRALLLALVACDNVILIVVFLWYSLAHLYELANWPLLQPLGYAAPYLYAFANIAKFIQVSKY